MSAAATSKGSTFVCPVCGAELTVVGRAPEGFRPVCCNQTMTLLDGRKRFYRCPVCEAELLAQTDPPRTFRPRCCNTDMLPAAA